MECSHLATSNLFPCTANSGWLVWGCDCTCGVHVACTGDLEMMGWQEVKLECCSRQRKFLLLAHQVTELDPVVKQVIKG